MTLNAIIANFQTFKLVDLLDIIIIAFLIYQLLGIINRTRAGQLAKGALLVMVAAAGRSAHPCGTVSARDPPRAGAHGSDRPVGVQAVQRKGALQ